LQQPHDDSKVAVQSSPSHGGIVVGRRIDALVLQQSFDHPEVAVRSSQPKGSAVVG
jgi:hypothetical protein